jgi:hypothetical protein
MPKSPAVVVLAILQALLHLRVSPRAVAAGAHLRAAQPAGALSARLLQDPQAPAARA